MIDLYQTSTKSGAVFAGGIAAHANSLFLAVKSRSNERPSRLIARFAAGIDGCIPEARGAADGDDPKGTVRATSLVYRQRPARAEASCPGEWQGPLHKKWSVSCSVQTMRSSEPQEARVPVADVDLRKFEPEHAAPEDGALADNALEDNALEDSALEDSALEGSAPEGNAPRDHGPQDNGVANRGQSSVTHPVGSIKD